MSSDRANSAGQTRPAEATESGAIGIAASALVPLLQHLERVLPELLERTGSPHETLQQVLAGEMPAGEAVRTHEVMLAAYGRFRAMTLPVAQPDGTTAVTPLAEQAAVTFREAVFAYQRANPHTGMLPDAAAWVRSIAMDPSYAKSISRLPWRRIQGKQLSQARALVDQVTREYGDYFLAEQAKVVHETDPYIHPLTLTRGALAVEVEEFARSHSGRVWAGLVGRVVEDVVGVEAVRENERGVAEIVQLQLLPNYTRALERLYVLTRQLQRSAVISEFVQRLSARPMQEVLDAFALDLLLTHPEFPASFRSTVYYLIRQQIPRLTEQLP